MIGVLMVVAGLAVAGSQIPTLTPAWGWLGLGLLVAVAGGLIVCDHPPRRVRRR